MSIPFSSANDWQPRRDGIASYDPQLPLYLRWVEEYSNSIISSDAPRLEVAGARDLLDRMAADHPGAEVSMRIGLGDINSPGCYRPDTKEVVLPSADEKLEWLLSQGIERAPSEKLETYRQEVVIEAFTAALVHSSYNQGDWLGCAPHDPEALGVYAYALNRYFVSPDSQGVGEALTEWLSKANIKSEPLTKSQVFEAEFLEIGPDSLQRRILISMMFEGHLSVRSFDRREWDFGEEGE